MIKRIPSPWIQVFTQSIMVLIVSTILAKVWVLAENSISQREELKHASEEIKRLEQRNLYLNRLIDFYHNGGNKPDLILLPIIPGPLYYERRGHDVKYKLHRRLADYGK